MVGPVTVGQGQSGRLEGTPFYGRVINKQQEGASQDSLDDYFCRGMDASGPASWERILREMEQGSLEDVGSMNYKAGVREEKRGMLDLKTPVLSRAPNATGSSQPGDPI